MKDKALKDLWSKGVQMMAVGYTWAEATLQVLRESKGWDSIPYQWATAGYSGAINSGKTICGILFGSTVFLGYLFGQNETSAPDIETPKRTKAIGSVNTLFKGFIERFGDSDCQTLTKCNFSKKEEIDRYIREEVYKETCFPQFEYVLSYCMSQKA